MIYNKFNVSALQSGNVNANQGKGGWHNICLQTMDDLTQPGQEYSPEDK